MKLKSIKERMEGYRTQKMRWESPASIDFLMASVEQLTERVSLLDGRATQNELRAIKESDETAEKEAPKKSEDKKSHHKKPVDPNKPVISPATPSVIPLVTQETNIV